MTETSSKSKTDKVNGRFTAPSETGGLRRFLVQRRARPQAGRGDGSASRQQRRVRAREAESGRKLHSSGLALPSLRRRKARSGSGGPLRRERAKERAPQRSRRRASAPASLRSARARGFKEVAASGPDDVEADRARGGFRVLKRRRDQPEREKKRGETGKSRRMADRDEGR